MEEDDDLFFSPLAVRATCTSSARAQSLANRMARSGLEVCGVDACTVLVRPQASCTRGERSWPVYTAFHTTNDEHVYLCPDAYWRIVLAVLGASVVHVLTQLESMRPHDRQDLLLRIDAKFLEHEDVDVHVVAPRRGVWIPRRVRVSDP